jgi:ketosteroid isomerase-like protein
MSEAVPRALVEAFYRAYAAREIEKIAGFLDDDVEWTISGPVDVLPFCGKRRGKPAVLELMGQNVPAVFQIFSFVTDSLVIDGDRVASLNCLAARLGGGGRVIRYRLAHFMRFRAGKVVENLSLLDSFDAAEQVLGHPLAIQDQCLQPLGDLVSV